MDSAVVQIREVTKWLITAFAAVGVALAAGSQLSEIGALSHFRLGAAFFAVLVAIAAIGVAIFSATRVLTPKAVSINRLAEEEEKSEVGKQVRDDPSLLLGHGKTLKEFAKRRDDALAAEDKAWEDYEVAEKEEKKDFRPTVKKARAARRRIDAAMGWVISYARFVEVSRRFRLALRWMLGSGIVASLAIAGFAWAAHPEADAGGAAETGAVSAAPMKIEIDLSPSGEKTLEGVLGTGCPMSSLAAIALAGPANALEVVTIPNGECSLRRFVLTPVLGTFEATTSAGTENLSGS
jgi:hypothetical protein